MMEDSVFEGTMGTGHWLWMGAGHWLWMLAIAIVAVIPAWRICQRTGYPGWMGILILIPIANIGLLYFIAFTDWPSTKNAEDHND